MRVLCLDAYDSYTHNLVALFQDNFRERELAEDSLSDEIIVIHNDACEWKELVKYLHSFDAVVVSPGPGNPNIRKDVQLAADIFTTKNIPILGVCLGMQTLVLAHGGQVTQMRHVKHGIVSQIDHVGDDLFRNVLGQCYGTRYHSLHVRIHELPIQLKALAFTSTKDEDELCLMACRHTELPHWGVQYHPDSICSTHGRLIIKNFLDMAAQFNTMQNRLIVPLHNTFKKLYGSLPRPIASTAKTSERLMLKWASVDTNKRVGINTIYEALLQRPGSGDFVLLDSAATPGKWTYFSCVSEGMFRINYNASDQILRDTRGSSRANVTVDRAWTILKGTMDQYELSAESPQSPAPFCGGFIGWFSYETGLQTMGLKDMKLDTNGSDIALAFIERCIALNTHANTIYVQSIAPDDDNWVSEMTARIKSRLHDRSKISRSTNDEQMASVVYSPSKKSYLSKIEKAKEEMRQGNSYEICLTDQTVLGIENQDPWQIYLSVRENNPAPYALFFELGDETLIGSSPEMFLRCENGFCEFRPIKGTLKKMDNTTFEVAETILRGEKERAENLMIVDLLRNDLHQLADVRSVQVPQLMEVEEYATVFQLVSSIVGRVSSPYTGLDVLARTLPPGSMTGAPKRRTCEILQNLEQRPRGVYSGVAGYWSVNGNHLWSVVIRSAYRGPESNKISFPALKTGLNSLWTVGAGGALLSVSSASAEWEEMKVKADSIVKGMTLSADFEILESFLFDGAAEDPCPLWNRHFERLTKACTHFGYSAPQSKDIMRSLVGKKFNDQRQKVRLTIQRSGQFEITCQLLKPIPELLSIKLDTIPTIIRNSDFIRYKTTFRRHYENARVRTATQGFDEVLLYNDDGYLMEATIFNIALWRHSAGQSQGIWITPPSSNCLLGVMRDKLLEDNVIVEGDLHKSHLNSSETIMLFNAVRGICWGKLVS